MTILYIVIYLTRRRISLKRKLYCHRTLHTDHLASCSLINFDITCDNFMTTLNVHKCCSWEIVVCEFPLVV